MRSLLLTLTSALILLGCAFLSAQDTGPVKVKLRLVDAETGKDHAGLVRLFPADGDKALALPGLFDRLTGIDPKGTRGGWFIVPSGGAETTLPRTKLRLQALSGLETALVRQDVDLTQGGRELAVKLPLVFRPEKDDLVAGNTHLHLMKVSAEVCDDYLKQVPAADRLKVQFVSYLERASDGHTYITNRYPIGPMPAFSGTGVVFNNGEEHRHNFQAYGQGYGHVMFLDIKELVKPVSLGPGITDKGNDDRALRPGIEDARRQGGFVLWCHNTNGHEFLSNLLAGRIDALNVFDGSRGGTYEERWYRCLNLGLRMPLSTGTDWFIYDFSRVYVKLPGEITPRRWLDALKAGRSTCTNGPLLSLTVDGQDIGSVINLKEGKTVRIEAKALGRSDFGKLQLIRNGAVVQSEPSRKQDSGYAAHLSLEHRVSEPCWFAARIEATERNELDAVLFAHTSPVYVDLGGERVFQVEAARQLLTQLEEAQADIKVKGTFSNDEARDRLLVQYRQAADDLKDRLARRKP
jgi:hypothetical protein